MTVNIPRDATFAGYPLAEAREILKFYKSGRCPSAFELSRRASISLSPFAIAGILQEFADAGFLERPEGTGSAFDHKLTDKGAALNYGTSARRTSKDKAAKVLSDLMTRCAAFNADPRAVEFVERVWVFGSMINPDKPDVGDIDIVIETGRRPDFPKGRKDWDEEMHARYPEHVHRHWSSYHEEWSVERVRHKEIYGARKHQLLSLTSIHTLESLHQPCQLLFDEARGGLVNDPVLPFHPESKGRGDDIRPRRVMPSLETSEFAPTDLRWLGTYMPSTATSEFKMLADEEACARAGVTAPTGIDGRYVLGILVTDGTGRKTVVTIKRDYVSAPDGPEFLIANISPPNILQAFDRDTQEMIVKQARRCALVDLIRLAARRNEMGIPRMIYADLTFDCGSAGDWAILGRDGARPPTIPEEQQFSLDITENGKRVHSRPDVSRFTPMDWRRFRLTVGISMADYNNRFEVDPADDPDEAAPPSL